MLTGDPTISDRKIHLQQFEKSDNHSNIDLKIMLKRQFLWVFAPTAKLFPKRIIDHQITLVLQFRTINCRPYMYSHQQKMRSR